MQWPYRTMHPSFFQDEAPHSPERAAGLGLGDERHANAAAFGVVGGQDQRVIDATDRDVDLAVVGALQTQVASTVGLRMQLDVVLDLRLLVEELGLDEADVFRRHVTDVTDVEEQVNGHRRSEVLPQGFDFLEVTLVEAGDDTIGQVHDLTGVHTDSADTHDEPPSY